MVSHLHQMQKRVIAVATEAPRSVEINDKSHSYIHTYIDRRLADPTYHVGPNIETIISDVDIDWNFAQHDNNILPLSHYF